MKAAAILAALVLPALAPPAGAAEVGQYAAVRDPALLSSIRRMDMSGNGVVLVVAATNCNTKDGRYPGKIAAQKAQ